MAMERKLTFSIASLVEIARPCSISGAVKAHTSSVIAQFLNASVPVADKSSDAGVIMLQILWPRKIQSFNIEWTALQHQTTNCKGQCFTFVGKVHEWFRRAQQEGPDLVLLQRSSSGFQHLREGHKRAAHHAESQDRHLRRRHTQASWLMEEERWLEIKYLKMVHKQTWSPGMMTSWRDVRCVNLSFTSFRFFVKIMYQLLDYKGCTQTVFLFWV